MEFLNLANGWDEEKVETEGDHTITGCGSGDCGGWWLYLP